MEGGGQETPQGLLPKMPELNLQPEIVGRDRELRELEAYLDKAAEGKGAAIFVAGEAGVGKTRLVNQLKLTAKSRGFEVLSGYSLYESLTPYMPFMEALRSDGLGYLFSEEAPKVEAVYLVTDTGLLIKDVLREESRLDPDIFASMLTTVGDFVKDSLSLFSGKKKEGGLNSLGFGDYRILVESRGGTNLAVILTGKENEFLISDMRETLSKVERYHGSALKDWDGDDRKTRGVERHLQPLITSGKYDGVFHAREDPKARRNLLFENVLLGLARQTETKPTLLCLEDLQWADPSTLALMHYVARNTKKRKLLIVGTYRPEDVVTRKGRVHPFVKTMQLMSHEDLCGSIDLQRLPREYMTKLLWALLGKTEFSDEFRNRIYKETEGNPLFIIELMRLLIDEKAIKAEGGVWRLAHDLREVDIPAKIHDVIVRRLSRVEKEDRKILDYASVIGDIFVSAVLVEALTMKRIHLLERLRALEQEHRLVHAREGKYRFDHAKIKEVLYGEIPQELRREYHSVVAESIEKLNKDDLDSVIGDLAFHYHLCGNRTKAPHYLLRVADKARSSYSNEEAVTFYAEALEFEDDPQKRMEIFEGLGMVYELTGEYSKSVESFGNALTLAKNNRKVAGIKVKIGRIHNLRGEYDASMKINAEALNLATGDTCEEQAAALSNIGYVHWAKGETDKALECFEKTLETREAINDQKGLSISLSNIGMMQVERGEYDKALMYFQKSLEIAEGIGYHSGIALTYNLVGNVYHYKAEYDKALECYGRALKIREKIGDQRGIAYSVGNIGTVYIHRGEHDKGLEFIDRSHKIGERIGDPRIIGYCMNNIGLALLKKGEHDKALEYHEKGLEAAERVNDQANVALALHGIGTVLASKGEYDKAIGSLEKGLKAREKQGDHPGEAESCCELADAHVRKGDLQKALEYCNRALEDSSKLGLRDLIAQSKGVLGMIYREQMKWKESVENFEESIRMFKEIGRPYDLGSCCYEFGLMWKKRGNTQEAREYLMRAIGVFKNMKLDKKSEVAMNALRDFIVLGGGKE